MNTLEQKPVLVFQSPLFTQSGYGHRGLDIARCLLRIGKWDLKIVPTRWGGTPNINIEELIKTDKELSELVNRILKTNLTEQPEIYIQHTIPNEFQAPAKFNIGLTAGIETTIPHGEWIEGLNRMDFNIVSSEFGKQVFKSVEYKKKDQNGNETPFKMTTPMEVLFEGVDTTVYRKSTTASTSVDDVLSSIKEDLCVLFVGHWLQGELGADRKDVGMLIRTFSEAFKNKKVAPALILKTSSGGFSHMDKEELLKKIKLAQSGIEGNLPNVYLLHGELTDEEMNDLYNHPKVKAHVSFTHGEGYGRPLLEASLSGKPVIASAWSGHLDFLDKDLSVLLAGDLKPVHQSAVNDWIVKEAQWFNVNYSSAARTFVDVYDNYDKYLSKSEKQAKINAEKFSMDKMQKSLDELLTKNVPVFPKKQRIVLPKLKKVELPTLS